MMVLGEGTGNTTSIAGYACSPVICSPGAWQEEWQVFICFLNRFFFELVNQNERENHHYAISVWESGFLNRNPVYTYLTCYMLYRTRSSHL